MPFWANESEFWSQVVRNGLPRFRCFRRSVPVEKVDLELGSYPFWQKLRFQMEPGDKIWPFVYPKKRRYWGKKYGYIVLRRGRFVGGVVTISE